MSSLQYKFTVLAFSVGLTAIAGCSTFGFKKDKKEVVDLGPQATEQVYYEKAQRALEKGQFSEASKSLEAIKSYYPTGQYAEQAELELIYSKFNQKDYPATISLAERFIQTYPKHPRLDYAYYVRGVANMEQNYDSLIRYTALKQAHRDIGYLKVAYQNFKDLIIRYPSSEYSIDAAQRMVFIIQELAENEMNVARFNLNRKAWLAALERSQWVIEHYPQTPQIPEAIATVSYAYEKLGDTQSAKQYAELLKLNYPHLVKSDGSVNLNAARSQRSFWNKATLGLFGRNAETQTQSQNIQTNPSSSERSLLNKVSFGLLDNKDQAPTENSVQ